MIVPILTILALAAPTLAEEGRTLLVPGTGAEPARVQLPCKADKLLAVGDQVYASCGAGGVAVVALTGAGAPRVATVRDMGGMVSDLFVLDGQAWARVGAEAKPVASGRDAGLPTPVTTSTTTETPAVEPRVVKSAPGRVVLGAGASSGIKIGDRFELFVDSSVDLEGQVAGSSKRVAIGEVTALSNDRAQLALGLNQDAPVGAVARTTRLAPPTASDAPRARGIWQLELAIRPFIAIGDKGFGDLTTGSIGYRFEDEVHLQLRLDPLGIAFPGNGRPGVVAMSSSMLLSWDARSFEVGLGFGLSTINGDNGSTGNTKDLGPGLAQMIRLGPTEGVNVTVYGLLATNESADFAFTTFSMAVQAPVAPSSWLVLRGAGGIARYALFEAGLRVLVNGNGTAGSLFLTPLLGYTMVGADHKIDSQFVTRSIVEANGLLIGVGAEWRL